MSQYDTGSLYDFLVNTPEGGLRKMLIDRASLTEVHFNLLLKVVRAGDADALGKHLDQKDFPRLRTTAAEDKIKEKFWDVCVATLLERGLLQPSTQKAAA